MKVENVRWEKEILESALHTFIGVDIQVQKKCSKKTQPNGEPWIGIPCL